MTLPSDRRIRALGRGVARDLVERVGQGFGKPLLAAVSGGADSSALLLLLTDTQSRHGWRVHAAHIDHRIQAESIRREFRAASQRLAAQAGVPFALREADARADAAAAGDGIEAAARRVRYAALTALALEHGAPIVAVAHTRDDQAETVLLHLLRGAGFDGLSGMPPVRALHDEVRLVRPMLAVSRAETEAVCCAYGWTPVQDPSNADLAHTRNRIRRTLLPAMAAVNPQIALRLAQLARAVAGDRELLELLGREALGQIREADGKLARTAFLTLPGPLQVRVLRAFCQAQGVTLTAERTAAALQVVQTGSGVVELPGGGRLSVARGTVRLDAGCPPPAGAG